MQVREPSNFFCSTKYTIIESKSDHLGVSSIGIAVPCGLLNGTIRPWHSVSLRIPQFLSSLDLPSAIASAQYCFFMDNISDSRYTKRKSTGQFIAWKQKDW